ncbi:hypothetical protein [Hydrogenivirga sp.]
MKEYFQKAIEVEMQRFGLFFTLMIAAGGGSVGITLGDLDTYRTLIAIMGIFISITSAIFALISYIKINRLLEELKNA